MSKKFVVYGLVQTEKAQLLAERKIYTVETSHFANKLNLINFFKKQFPDIKISSIRSCNYKINGKFFRGQKGQTKGFKKFYITLSEGALDLNSLKDNISNVG